VAWGQYAPAIHRWEIRLGRVAPSPTELSPKGNYRLSPRAVEFMMGLPAGWVTDVPGISRNEQLKMLGNGVVPQQAEAALRALIAARAAA
jgi:DNA (cytosine-5)-methyltransferase 1